MEAYAFSEDHFQFPRLFAVAQRYDFESLAGFVC